MKPLLWRSRRLSCREAGTESMHTQGVRSLLGVSRTQSIIHTEHAPHNQQRKIALTRLVQEDFPEEGAFNLGF